MCPLRSFAAILARCCSLTFVAVFALGVYNQLNRAARHWPEFGDRKYLAQITELNLWLFDCARQYDWKSPAISFDRISPMLNSATVTDTGYEQTGQYLQFQALLGGSIFAPSREETFQLLGQSDFVILTSPRETGLYPFNQAIEAYWPDLKAW